ncbi:MAG: type IX secretion system membrane protein PorP/SprF [Bacteroidales bacterium]
MKKIILLVLLGVIAWSVSAQQDPMYTHYMYNTLGINPAYAGSRDALTLTMLHRSQWVSFPGTPVTQTVTAHAPVLNDMFSLGLSLVNDEVGPVKNTSFFIDYAYRIRLTPTSRLAFGLKAGFNSMQANLSSLKLDPSGKSDRAFSEDLTGQISPNLGFGVYYSKDKFYAGISTPRLFKGSYSTVTNSDSSLYKEQQHYFFIAGGSISLNDAVEFVPTTFMKITKGAPVEADFTGCFVFNNKFTVGGMYRTLDAAGLLAGIALSEQLYAGYSFDWSFGNTTAKYNNGSHEIVLRYDFVFTGKGKIRSPRYF